MGQFMINEARLQRGHVAFMTPGYRKPMWDDDKDNDGKKDGLIGAPSVATVVDIAANIAISAILGPGIGNVLLGAALNMIDDAVFAVMDVSSGYAEAGDAFGALGRKALTSAATSVAGGALNGVGAATDGASGLFVEGLRGAVETSSVLGEAAVNAGFAAATATVNKAISTGIEVGFTGGSWDDFGSAFDSWEDWGGAAGSAVQAGMNTLAGNFFTTDGTNVGLDGRVFNLDALGGAASLTANLAGAATEYAFAGQTKLNVLDLGMFGDGKLSGGILELGIGDGGSLFEIGQGGYKADIGTIATTMGGLRDVLKVTDAKIAGEGSHALGVLNTSNYTAISGNLELASDLWNRDVKVSFEDLGEGYGLYRHTEDPNTIVLNQRFNTNDREDVAVSATTAVHEGQHLYDRRDLGATNEARAYGASARAYAALIGQLELDGNTEVVSAIVNGILDPESYIENTGDVDHFRPFIDETSGTLGVRKETFGELIAPNLDPDGPNALGQTKTIGEQMLGMLQVAGQVADVVGIMVGAPGAGSAAAKSIARVADAVSMVGSAAGLSATAMSMRDIIDVPLAEPFGDAWQVQGDIAAAMGPALAARGLGNFEWWAHASNRPGGRMGIDRRTFEIADEIGFQYEMSFDENMSPEEREAAANAMFRGMMFIADMHEGRGMSAAEIKVLMEGTVGPQMAFDTDIGVVYSHVNIPGFEDVVPGMVQWRDDHAQNFIDTGNLNWLDQLEYYFGRANGNYDVPNWMHDAYGNSWDEYQDLQTQYDDTIYGSYGHPLLHDIVANLQSTTRRGPFRWSD